MERVSAIPRVAPGVLFPTLFVLLVAAVLLGVGVGAVGIAPWQTAAIVADHLGADLDIAYSRQQDAIVWAIRLPRVLLGMAVGSALAVAGAALQGMFRNPLADPGLIGVSSGASLGAVTAVLVGASTLGVAALPIAAFVGAMAAALAVYLLSRHDGRTEVVTLVLVGIALNAIASAGTGLLTYAGSDDELREVVFWSLGSLGSATWRNVGATLPFVALGLAFIPRRGRELNLLVLGEREARHLGVDSERVRLELIALTAVLT
ncbi:MAG: FecCD family ABC transporter permease, partial [Thermomicrobiales bacterium]